MRWDCRRPRLHAAATRVEAVTAADEEAGVWVVQQRWVAVVMGRWWWLLPAVLWLR